MQRIQVHFHKEWSRCLQGKNSMRPSSVLQGHRCRHKATNGAREERQQSSHRDYEIAGGSRVPIVQGATEIGASSKIAAPLTEEERVIAKGFRQHWTEIRDPRMHALNNAIVELTSLKQVIHHYHEYGGQYRVPNVVCAAHRVCHLDPDAREPDAIEPLLGFLDRYSHSYWGFCGPGDIAALLYPYAHYSRAPRVKVSTAASEQLYYKLRGKRNSDAINIYNVPWGMPENNELQAYKCVIGLLSSRVDSANESESLFLTRRATAVANQAWAMARCSVFSNYAYESIINQVLSEGLLEHMDKEGILRLGWSIAYGLCDAGTQEYITARNFGKYLEPSASERLHTLDYEEAVLLAWSLMAMRQWATRIFDMVLTAQPLQQNPKRLPFGTKRQLVSLHRMIQKYIPEDVYVPQTLPTDMIMEVDAGVFNSIEFDSQDPMRRVNNKIARRIRDAGFDIERNIEVAGSFSRERGGRFYLSDEVVVVPLGLADVQIAFQVRNAPGWKAGIQEGDEYSALNNVAIDGHVHHLSDDAAKELMERGWTIAVIDYMEWTRLDRTGQLQYIRELAHGYAHQVSRLKSKEEKFFWRKNDGPKSWKAQSDKKVEVLEQERKRKQIDAEQASRSARYRRRRSSIGYSEPANSQEPENESTTLHLQVHESDAPIPDELLR
eukprot:gb/GECG01015754.1/.p1 GENE.gb/GECG01015754.1/~~gb/GECG01015754.1/.p1  ORF type:complete len:665 (+),score=69.33 gb/GECG01015754.1/:1-1995(+)